MLCVVSSYNLLTFVFGLLLLMIEVCFDQKVNVDLLVEAGLDRIVKIDIIIVA